MSKWINLVEGMRCPPAWMQPYREEGHWIREHRALTKEQQAGSAGLQLWPWTSYTILANFANGYTQVDGGGCGPEVVMEDSPRELRRHLPIVLAARGRVLVTGLGLGCVVRGLLAREEVERVDVIEIDENVVRLSWDDEFRGDPRARLIVGDALKVKLNGEQWDYAWHDIWDPKGHLQVLHARLLTRFARKVRHGQGAWGFPRQRGTKRRYSDTLMRVAGYPLIGAQTRRRAS